MMAHTFYFNGLIPVVERYQADNSDNQQNDSFLQEEAMGYKKIIIIADILNCACNAFQPHLL